MCIGEIEVNIDQYLSILYYNITTTKTCSNYNRSYKYLSLAK